MDWNDEGFVLSAKSHGENALIVSLLTRENGRHAGLVRGGAGVRARGIYQPGNLLRAHWRARLVEHLGSYRCELSQAIAAKFLYEAGPLLALSAATTLLDLVLPEREPTPHLFGSLSKLLSSLDRPGWQTQYVRWELDLLGELGFGLDLTECAATGTKDSLVYVSPKSGKAVSARAAEPFRDRLLALPQFLLSDDQSEPSAADVADGLNLTGYFLKRHVLGGLQWQLPTARNQLFQEIRKSIEKS